jgi:hypothetical protein
VSTVSGLFDTFRRTLRHQEVRPSSLLFGQCKNSHGVLCLSTLKASPTESLGSFTQGRLSKLPGLVWNGRGQGSHKGADLPCVQRRPKFGLPLSNRTSRAFKCREPFFNCSTRRSRPPRREAAVVWSIQKVWQWQSDSRSNIFKEFQLCTDLNVATLQSPAGAPQSPSGILAVVWS